MANPKDKVESDLNSVIGTMALEGFTLNSDEIAQCRAVLSGEADADELVNELFDKYRKNTRNDGDNS